MQFYLKVLDSLGDFHGHREQLVKATDERISDGVKDKLVAQRKHPGMEILHVFIQQQITAEGESPSCLLSHYRYDAH